jgi:hypothetical protein
MELPPHLIEFREKWRSAYLNHHKEPNTLVFATTLVNTRNNRQICGLLEYEKGRFDPSLNSRIIIPLKDETPDDQIIGEISQLKNPHFSQENRNLLADRFSVRIYFAFLNRRAAQVTSKEMPGWFYQNLEVGHLQNFNRRRLYIGSFGSLDTFDATIEFNRPEYRRELRRTDFATFVEDSIPHLRVIPLPAEDYFSALREQATHTLLGDQDQPARRID